MKQTVRFLAYVLSIVLVGYLYNAGSEFAHSENVVLNFNLYTFFIIMYPISIGILLGLIGLASKPKIDRFQYDWIFALGLGIPLAYVTFQPLLLRFNILPPYLLSFNYPISGILLGFVLVLAIKGIPYRKKNKFETKEESESPEGVS